MDKKKQQQIDEISNEVKEEMGQFDILDVILDESNVDPIPLQDEKGNRISFEQVAVVPYKQKIYVILKPIDKIEGIADDEAVVFVADESVSPTVLRVEQNQEIAVKIFDEYYNLVDEAVKNGKVTEKKEGADNKVKKGNKGNKGTK